MIRHPGVMLVTIWAVMVTAFIVLPFQIETRTVSVYGFVLLGLFITTFVAGTFLASPIMPKRQKPFTKPLDLTPADRLIKVVVGIAALALLVDFAAKGVTTLEEAFLDRNQRSVGVLLGHDTGGSLFFQIGFLTYPMSYVAIAREIMFRERINFLALCGFGFAPLVLAALVMGGRGPILYGFVMLVAAFLARGLLFPRAPKVQSRDTLAKRFAAGAVTIVGMLVAMNYFVDVFLIRADIAGGVDAMRQISALNWGVSFDGPGSEMLRTIIGEGNMYLIYAFLWYLVQGLVISNVVFTHFDGDPTWGIYGIDLGAAIVRRIEPQFVSSRLLPLADINVYGFLPNAFGSLYVDFKYFAFIPTFAWGYACGYAYRRMARSQDARWVLLGPFITVGLIFSLINTPIGFGNGLMTHIWLFAVTLMIRPVRAAVPRLARA